MNVQTDKTSVASTTAKAVDIKRILQMIPHRYPMLMVDKVIEMQLDHSAVGIKNVSINEPFFQGHFPSEPVMPGVLIVEAMAQTAAVLVVATYGQESEGKLVYFMSIDGVRFRRPVFPGDRLELHVEKVQSRASVCYDDEASQAVVELTYNWDQKKPYEIGSGFGHLAVGVPDVKTVCEHVTKAGGKVTRAPGPVKFGTTVIAFVEDPDGYKIEL